MKKQIDINCDLGEGMEHDEAIMPFISSANIACGYHAGNEDTINRTIRLCLKYDVAIGAHPSFDDRHNFGRTEMIVPADELYDLISAQIQLMNESALNAEGKLVHVKPHGALYNMAARDPDMAAIIVKAVKDFNEGLVLIGLSGSHLITEARKAGLRAMNEVFADRTYQDNGSLTPRTESNSIIESIRDLKMHVSSMILGDKILSVNGREISVAADTICLHGDNPHAPAFAKVLFEFIRNEGISVTSFSV